MATYERQQRQRQDPLELAMSLYKMFNQPQGDDDALLLGLLNQQNDQAYRQSQLGIQQEGLDVERQRNQIAQQAASQKGEMPLEDVNLLLGYYTDPNATLAQKVLARSKLDPNLIAQIDAERAQLGQDIGGPGGSSGAGQAQPRIQGPVGLGSDLGQAARSGLGLPPNDSTFNPLSSLIGMFKSSAPPINAMQLNPGVFSEGPNRRY